MSDSLADYFWGGVLAVIAMIGAAGKALAKRTTTVASNGGGNGTESARRTMDALTAVARHTEQIAQRIERIERAQDQIAIVVSRIDSRTDVIVELRSRIEELARIIDHLRQDGGSRRAAGK